LNWDLFGESEARAGDARDKQAESDAEIVAIYADESCLGNGREGSNPGGAGGVVEMVDPETQSLARWDYWVSEPATTNNRMALRSVIEAFSELSKMNRQFRVVFTSDSRYIVDGMRSWVHGWVARGWRRKGGAIENLELWKQAVRAVAPFESQWNWVRGHNGQPQNEYANHLATRAAADQTSSDGLVKSGFYSWLGTIRSSNGFRETAPFPEAGTFKPSKRVWTI
jgi:ribonuclease HI